MCKILPSAPGETVSSAYMSSADDSSGVASISLKSEYLDILSKAPYADRVLL